MLASKLLSAMSSGADAPIYSDDVFSAYTYIGNGSSQTINNGIDLAGRGGLVWIKERSNFGGHGHWLFNTNAGPLQALKTHATSAQASEPNTVTAFNANGFSFGSSVVGNASGATFVAWTFRKAPKFFDVQTVSHTNGTPTNISLSSLGTVGAVITKITTTTGDWITWHRSLTAANNVRLNTIDAQSTVNAWLSVSGTTATMASAAPTGTYAVYAFAHDTTPDGIIQCGSFTTDATGFGDVSLGWEPQYMLFKRTDNNSAWSILDSMRGFARAGTKVLYAEGLYSEGSASADSKYPTATGARLSDNTNGTYLYIAIRRPNKPPTTGTQVYNHVARTATGAAVAITGIGFTPDMVLSSSRIVYGHGIWDRLRGIYKNLFVADTSPEQYETASVTSFDRDGITVGADGISCFINGSGTYVTRFFKRAPGFFDQVVYVGTGTPTTVPHNLASEPELMIVRRADSTAGNWLVYVKGVGTTKEMWLDEAWAPFNNNFPWNNTAPTASVLSVSTALNLSGGKYSAYLFATCPGVSKTGLYTGNGSSQTINCGFAAGARFILIKRTDAIGNWYTWDAARGIVSGNDPRSSFNDTSAEVTTDDSVDPDSTGFIVNQVAATDINVSAATYLYFAIA